MSTRSTTTTRIRIAAAVATAAAVAALAGAADAGATVDSRASELAAIADYAAEQGLSGLSPASMQPVRP